LRACTAIADIGDIWYLYDANGNVTEARQGGHSESNSTDGQVVAQGDVRWTSEGFGLDRGGQGGQEEKKVWARYYSWDEENRLKQSVEGELSVEYRYGADGQRAVKYSKRGESLYFDAAARFQRALQSIPLGKRREAPYAMWSESINGASIRQSKHVYVGQTRVSTRLNYKGHPDTGFEQANTYYYHGDHLGSAQLVTDPDGQEYEHIEYTPYGELWVEKTRDGIDAIPFRFTGKELDAETGLYYYGARYLDPKTSVWLSADPALGEYVPGAPTDEEARKRNGNLPGMGGVFNTVNLHLYHYAGNNPIKYTDPDGKQSKSAIAVARWESLTNSLNKFAELKQEVMTQIREVELKIDILKGGVENMKIEYRMQTLLDLANFASIFDESVNASMQQQTPQMMLAAFLANVDLQGLAEYASDYVSAGESRITKEEIFRYEVDVNMEIKKLEAENKGNEALLQAYVEEMKLLEKELTH